MNALIHHTEKFSNPKDQKTKAGWSPEVIAIFVFVGGYILLRIIEKFVTFVVPEWVRGEVYALYRWAPILIPIAFGLTYTGLTRSNDTKIDDPTWKKLFGKKKARRRFSPDEKRIVGAQQNWRCAQCQQALPAAFEVDHITPLWSGGEDTMNNLQALCPNCHGDKTLHERMKMWAR
jgi:hypothetical protein